MRYNNCNLHRKIIFSDFETISICDKIASRFID